MVFGFAGLMVSFFKVFLFAGSSAFCASYCFAVMGFSVLGEGQAFGGSCGFGWSCAFAVRMLRFFVLTVLGGLRLWDGLVVLWFLFFGFVLF